MTESRGRTPLDLVVYGDEEVRGLVVSDTRKAARLRGAGAAQEVEVLNIAEDPIRDLAVKAEDTQASTAAVRRERYPRRSRPLRSSP